MFRVESDDLIVPGQHLEVDLGTIPFLQLCDSLVHQCSPDSSISEFGWTAKE
jgi:hypothetical protein